MRVSGILLVFVAIKSAAAFAELSCYTLVNGTTHTVQIDFDYPGHVVPVNGDISFDLLPGAQYPVHPPLCFTPGTSGTANLGREHWENVRGSLSMGYVSGAAQPGTYKILDGIGPVPPPPDTKYYGRLFNGTLFVKVGRNGNEVTESTGVGDFQIWDTLIAVLNGDALSVKDGINSLWVPEATGVRTFAVSGDRVGVLQGDRLSVKQGLHRCTSNSDGSCRL